MNRLAEVTQEAKESVREYLLGVKHSSAGQSLFTTLRQYFKQYSHTITVSILNWLSSRIGGETTRFHPWGTITGDHPGGGDECKETFSGFLGAGDFCPL